MTRFLELTRTNNLEMVNWLFLHEVELAGVARYISDQEASTRALKKADGTKREIYDVWLDLKESKLTAARGG